MDHMELPAYWDRLVASLRPSLLRSHARTSFERSPSRDASFRFASMAAPAVPFPPMVFDLYNVVEYVGPDQALYAQDGVVTRVMQVEGHVSYEVQLLKDGKRTFLGTDLKFKKAASSHYLLLI
jgi:hypothetical protein